jgi:hypothetical protein
MAIVLPNLLKANNVRIELVQPRHDLLAALPPPSADKRVRVQLHDT